MRTLSTWTSILAGLLLIVSGCGSTSSDGDTGTLNTSGSEANFRMLVSDEVNAISDFSELWVSISNIGLREGEEDDGSWVRFAPPPAEGEETFRLDLVPLIGTKAQEVWSGTIPPGDYSKVFLYVDEVWGTLVATGETVDLMLPSGKLQISKPFSVTEDGTTTFVYDITVVAAGNKQSGVGYKLKPQLAESGADQEFDEVVPEHAQERRGEDELQLILDGDPFVDDVVTLLVTDAEGPVAGAQVTVDGAEAGTTAEDGTLVLSFTAGEEIEIEAVLGEQEGELEIEPEEAEDVAEWFEGTILAVTEGAEFASPWTVEIAGVTDPVTVYVHALEGEDAPIVGALVELEGILLDGELDAIEAEVELPEEDTDEDPEEEFAGELPEIEDPETPELPETI